MLKGNILPSFFFKPEVPTGLLFENSISPPSDIGISFQLRFQPHLPPPVTKL